MQTRKKKKSLSTGTHCAAILHLPNARERSDVSVYQMPALVSSQLPGNQNECSTIEKFKDCKMSRMQIKVTEVNAMTRFWLSIHFQNFIKCYFYLSYNCLCFLFPLIYGHHGTFTGFRTYDNYGHFTEHSRIYGRTAITDFSRNFQGLTDERQLRKFHWIFTDLRMSRNCSRIIMVTGHKTSDSSCIILKYPSKGLNNRINN